MGSLALDLCARRVGVDAETVEGGLLVLDRVDGSCLRGRIEVSGTVNLDLNVLGQGLASTVSKGF